MGRGAVRALIKVRELIGSAPAALLRGKVGVALIDLRRLAEDSEIGGEGGVSVDVDSDDLAGGVANTGDDVTVPGDRSKISRCWGVDGLRYKGVGLRRRNPCPSVCRSFS